jgi:hypothetical protein
VTETSARHHSSNTTRQSVVRTSPSPDRSKNQRITVTWPTEHCCSLPMSYVILRGEDVQVWCHLRTLDPGRVHLQCRKPLKGVRGMRTCSVNREGEALFQVFPFVPDSTNPTVDKSYTPWQGVVTSSPIDGGGAIPHVSWENFLSTLHRGLIPIDCFCYNFCNNF